MKEGKIVRIINANKNSIIPNGIELDVLSFTNHGVNVMFNNVVVCLDNGDFEIIEEPEQQKEFTYTKKKETDFILISSKEVCLNIQPLGYDVVFKNELNGVETFKTFRTPLIEYVKTVMSSEEINAVPKS